MGKKNKKRQQEIAAEAAVVESISYRGWKVIAFGVGILVLGFIVLSRTDPMGKNWASHMAPFLILGAYGVIGYGVFVPESNAGSSEGGQ